MEQNRVSIVPQGRVGKTADFLMQPVMYWLQGNWQELPQRTHFWNNQKFSVGELDWLAPKDMVKGKADKQAGKRFVYGLLPVFHAPRFGGWKRYLVLQPLKPVKKWYVGWVSGNVVGVSKITLSSPVRVLRGPTDAMFYGVDDQGRQIPLEQISCGKIGDNQWGQIPLL